MEYVTLDVVAGRAISSSGPQTRVLGGFATFPKPGWGGPTHIY